MQLTKTEEQKEEKKKEPADECTIRTRKFMSKRLLQRRQMIVDVVHPGRANVSKAGYRDSMSREGESFWDQFRTFRQLKEYAAVGEVKSWKRGAFREFAREHPAEANCLRQSRRAGNFAIATGLAGAVGSGAFAYKYGRSGLGATLAATAGFAAAALMGGHAASVYYWGFSPKVDPLDASILFLKWVKDHEQS
jgi:hypothetical protein